MDYICQVFDRSVIENPSEYQHYLATSHKKNDKSLYIKYTINNINLDELDKLLNDYITTHTEKFNLYLVSCTLVIEFDNNFTENIDTNSFYITDIVNIKRILFYNIYYYIPRVYKPSNVSKIKHLILKTINDRCNMTYKYYKNLPKGMVERRSKNIIAKNPSIINKLNRNTNHPLIRKYSHIPFKTDNSILQILLMNIMILYQ